jgi:hypothetical protein
MQDVDKALEWMRETFPRWEALQAKVKTIGELLHRQTGTLLNKFRGWETFEDGLREHMALSPRQFAALVKRLDAQPLAALAGATNG